MTQTPTLGFAGQSSTLFSPAEIDGLMHVEFERAQRYGYGVTCMLIGIDQIEQLAAFQGWESRELILNALCAVVRKETREGDLFGYMIDDRLLVLFPHTNSVVGKDLADRLLKRARELRFEGAGGTLRISLSIGLSHNTGPGKISFGTLKEVAQEGFSVADAGGGDRWAETELYGLIEGRRERQKQEAEPDARSHGLAEVLRRPDYRQMLEEMVAVDGDLEKAVAVLVEQIMERAQEEARAEAEAGGPGDKESTYQREIDILRRRVAKLTQSLGVTEQELLRLRQLKTVDDGVPSIYRDVQGLGLEDSQAEIKKDLMSKIFEANLDLHRKHRKSG